MANLYQSRVSTRAALETAFRAVSKLPYGYVLTVREPTRTDEQNKLMWPLLKCFEQQTTLSGQKLIDEQWKHVFMNYLGHTSDMLPTLDGCGWFPVGLRTSKLTKAQFSELIELIYSEGAARGVTFKDPKEE